MFRFFLLKNLIAHIFVLMILRTKTEIVPHNSATWSPKTAVYINPDSVGAMEELKWSAPGG